MKARYMATLALALLGIPADEALAGTPVLFLSGYAEHGIQVGTFGDRTVEVIQKPLRPRLLIRRVREVLDRESARGR